MRTAIRLVPPLIAFATTAVAAQAPRTTLEAAKAAAIATGTVPAPADAEPLPPPVPIAPLSTDMAVEQAPPPADADRPTAPQGPPPQ
ncbi:MAG: hypothetical protein PGN09_02505 [Sphingomonas fennica]